MNNELTPDKIVMIGIDHKHCPLEIREKVSFTLYNIDGAYKKLIDDNVLLEAVIVSTCNRSEIYALFNGKENARGYLLAYYKDFFDLNDIDIELYTKIRKGKKAINHLFEVTCGFQSMVLGEDQVLGQVKESYKTAMMHKTAGKILSRLFIDSITAAKRIKCLTGISENPLSVSSIGVKLIEQQLKSLKNKSALVIGLGEMSRITIQNLLLRDVGKIFVTNRTRRRCRDFAKAFPGIKQIDFNDRYSMVGNVDIIVSCTAAPHYVLTKNKFEQYYMKQGICILDLAIPRDVHPDISQIESVDLYRLDDLETIAKENTQNRLKARDESQEVLNESVENYINWIKQARATEDLVVLQEYAKKIVTKELIQLQKKLKDIDKHQMQLIEKAFHNVEKQFIHHPMVRIKQLATDKEEYRSLLSDIFKLEDEFKCEDIIQ
jgi:glutamyl-tRNA reductase